MTREEYLEARRDAYRRACAEAEQAEMAREASVLLGRLFVVDRPGPQGGADRDGPRPVRGDQTPGAGL